MRTDRNRKIHILHKKVAFLAALKVKSCDNRHTEINSDYIILVDTPVRPSDLI